MTRPSRLERVGTKVVRGGGLNMIVRSKDPQRYRGRLVQKSAIDVDCICVRL